MRTTTTVSRPTASDSNPTASSDKIFTRTLLQYREEMLSLCRRCTSREADAEEAFSRAALLLYRKLPIYCEHLENLRGWVLRLTYNACMGLHRENRRRSECSLEEIGEGKPVLLSLLTSPTMDPETAYLSKENYFFLQACIDELPERLRNIVLVHLRLGSYREIAEYLSIKEPNARKRMQEARRVISDLLTRRHHVGPTVNDGGCPG